MTRLITFGSSSCNVISINAFFIPNRTNSFISFARPKRFGCPPNPRHNAHTRLCVCLCERECVCEIPIPSERRTCSFLMRWVQSRNSIWDLMCVYIYFVVLMMMMMIRSRSTSKHCRKRKPSTSKLNTNLTCTLNSYIFTPHYIHMKTLITCTCKRSSRDLFSLSTKKKRRRQNNSTTSVRLFFKTKVLLPYITHEPSR